MHLRRGLVVIRRDARCRAVRLSRANTGTPSGVPGADRSRCARAPRRLALLWSRPDRRDGEGGEAVAEAEPVRAGVQHDSAHERVPELVADAGEMTEVPRRRLDLQAGDATVVALEDEVDLGAVAVAEVVEANSRVGPGLLLGNLVDDEGLQYRSGGWSSRYGESRTTTGACATEAPNATGSAGPTAARR